MDWIIEKISQMDVGQLIATAIMVWFAMRDTKKTLSNEMKQVKDETKQVKDSLSKEIKEVKDSLSKEINDVKSDLRNLDCRLSRVEGILMNKECCMIRDSRKIERAE